MCGRTACTVRRAGRGDPSRPLSGKNGKTGKILIKRSEFDNWIERFRENDFIDIEAIAEDMVKGVI